MKESPRRIVLTTKDIQLVLGKKDRSARDFMQLLREHLNKAPFQVVTITEFLEFVGIPESEIKGLLF